MKEKKFNTYYDLFAAYEQICDTILSKTQTQMADIASHGIQIITDLSSNYKVQKIIKESLGSKGQTDVEDHFFPNQLIGGKKYSSMVEINGNDKGKKKYFMSVQKEKKQEKDELKASLEALNLYEDGAMDENIQMASYDIPNQKINDLKMKSLGEMIKRQKLIKNDEMEQNEGSLSPSEDEDSQYSLTDYSSNESSNDGDYHIHYKDEDEDQKNKPLFGGMFQKSKTIDEMVKPALHFKPLTSSQPDLGNKKILKFNMKDIELLKSPKKTQKKGRRLYAGSKRIPRWAEELKIFETNVAVEAKEIFGECKVQHLDTNLIFKMFEEQIERTSSAKWNPYNFKV